MYLADRYGKPKVSILIRPILVEDVCRLDVTMKESSLMDIVISYDKLPHDFDSLKIRDGFSLFNQSIQISFTKLGNEICIIPGGIDIVQMQDMFGVRKCLQGCNFELEQHLIDGIFEFGHLDDLYADFLTSLVVEALVHCAAVALSDVLVDFVCVPLYCFHLNIIVK